jgi:hypothetical protein
MEKVLGQPLKFMGCTKLSTLTEMISTIEESITVLVVSSLTSIVASMSASSDAKGMIAKGMSMVGASLRDLSRYRHEPLRVFFAPCTPKQKTEHQKLCIFAMVRYLQ